MWKFRSLRQIVHKSINSRTATILANGSGKKNNQIFCHASRFNLENLNSPVSFHEITKENFKDYQFPIIKLSYDREDVINHAKSGKFKQLYIRLSLMVDFLKY